MCKCFYICYVYIFSSACVDDYVNIYIHIFIFSYILFASVQNQNQNKNKPQSLESKRAGPLAEQQNPWNFLEIDEYFVAGKIAVEKHVPVVDAFHVNSRLPKLSHDGHHYLRYVVETEVHVFLSHLLCLRRGGLL